MKKFTEYSTPLNLSNVNKEILELWDRHNLFETSMDVRKGCLKIILSY